MKDKYFDVEKQVNKEAYNNFAMIVNALKSYSFDKTEKGEEILTASIAFIRDCKMPLPSGRWGNSLAVALEMQQYTGALFILHNAEQLDIDVNAISSEFGDVEPCGAEEVFKMSLSYFNDKPINAKKFSKEDLQAVTVYNNNIDSISNINDFFKKKKSKIKSK